MCANEQAHQAYNIHGNYYLHSHDSWYLYLFACIPNMACWLAHLHTLLLCCQGVATWLLFLGARYLHPRTMHYYGHLPVFLVVFYFTMSAIVGHHVSSAAGIGLPKLQPLAPEKWPYDKSGHPARTDIFCTGTLGSITRPTTQASAVLQSLCNRKGPTYWSNSALDAFLAGRFAGKCSYGVGLWEHNASSTPCSTEPNTPWLLADVVSVLSQEQTRADSWKQVTATAQVDLFLCSDADCTVLSDLQAVHADQHGHDSSTLALSFAGLSTQLATGSGTTDSDTTYRAEPIDSWVPPDLQSGDANQPIVSNVIHNVTAAHVIPSNEADSGVHALLLDHTQTTLWSGHPWQAMRMGQYRARLLLPDKFSGPAADWDDYRCITLLLPKHR